MFKFTVIFICVSLFFFIISSIIRSLNDKKENITNKGGMRQVYKVFIDNMISQFGFEVVSERKSRLYLNKYSSSMNEDEWKELGSFGRSYYKKRNRTQNVKIGIFYDYQKTTIGIIITSSDEETRSQSFKYFIDENQEKMFKEIETYLFCNMNLFI